jgi:hypothetical protein
MIFFIWLNQMTKILNQVLNIINDQLIRKYSRSFQLNYNINRKPIPKAFNGFELRLELIVN